MVKTLFLLSSFAVGMSSPSFTYAVAQDDGQAAPQSQPRAGSAGARSGNITPTGATVPNPGVSQGAGTTDLDKGIQREDNKITDSICKGC